MIAALGLAGVVTLAGPLDPARAAASCTAAPTCSRWPAACAPTATATASRTCWSRRWPRARRSSPPRSPASPSWSTDGVNGLLVAPEDPTALADALLRLHDDPRLAAGLAAAGAARRWPSASTATALAAPARRAVRRRRAVSASRPRAAPGALRQSSTSTATARSPRPPPRRPVHARRRDAATSAADPDWLAGGLADDEEWRIEWVKFYDGLDLAHAFAPPGDEALPATPGSGLVEAFIAQVPVGHDPSEVTARRIQNWIYAWQRSPPPRRSGRCEPAWPSALAERLRADAAHLAATPDAGAQPPHARALHAAADRASRSPTTPTGPTAPSARWPATPRTDFGADGVHRERCTDYHLHRAALAASARSRTPAGAGLPLPAALSTRGRPRLRLRAARAAPRRHDPGAVRRRRGRLPAAARARRRRCWPGPTCDWAATAGRRGHAPGAAHGELPDRRLLHVQRSGWGDGGRGLRRRALICSTAARSATAATATTTSCASSSWPAATALVVDPGRFTYADGERRLAALVQGHRRPQHGLRRRPRPDAVPARASRRAPTSTARLLARAERTGLDVIVAEVRSPRYDAVHTRALALVGGDYWVVHDRLAGRTDHRYEARWHLPAAAWRCTTIGRGDGQSTVSAPGVRLVVPDWCGALRLEDGWVSPRVRA